jgi:hypothetical protein
MPTVVLRVFSELQVSWLSLCRRKTEGWTRIGHGGSGESEIASHSESTPPSPLSIQGPS